MTKRGREVLRRAKRQGWLSGFDFSVLMQDLLIPPGGYVIDTGNWECVNAAVAVRIVPKIRRHPLLWRWFFTV